MPKKSMGGRKNGQIGERKWEQISIFDDYLMGDVEGQDDEYFERKEPANVFRIDNKQDNQHRNRGLDESFRDSLSADQKISGSGVSRATGTFIQKLSLSKMKQDMVQKKMMEWLMNQPLIKNRPTYI